MPNIGRKTNNSSSTGGQDVRKTYLTSSKYIYFIIGLNSCPFVRYVSPANCLDPLKINVFDSAIEVCPQLRLGPPISTPRTVQFRTAAGFPHSSRHHVLVWDSRTIVGRAWPLVAYRSLPNTRGPYHAIRYTTSSLKLFAQFVAPPLLLLQPPC